MIVGGCGDAGKVPEVALPLVETRVLAAGIEKKDVWCTLDEPSAVKTLDTGAPHAVEGGGEVGVGGLLLLDLHGSGLVAEGANETVAVAIL